MHAKMKHEEVTPWIPCPHRGSAGVRATGLSAPQPAACSEVTEPFETVVARHSGTVLRVCRAVVGPVDAEDAWSETFLAAMRAYPTLRPDSNIEAWLVTIAHRKGLDLIRSRGRRATPTAEPPEPREPARAPELPELADGAEAWTALKRLPQRQREAIAYHHIAGLPYAEVAAVTGGTVAAARKAASDGIAALRRSLEQEKETP
jgi:RNA polymerase sigma factor (sigma-70 family)